MRAVTTAALGTCIFAQIAFGQTVTRLLTSGPAGSKRDLVVIGDGFTAAQQGRYNTLVRDLVVRGVFNDGVFREDANAFNIHRINAASVDSGVTQIDSTGAVTTARNTVLDYRYSGDWDRCWMEPSTNTPARLNNLLALVPGWDFVFIILNEPGFGGCARGNQLAVTSTSAVSLALHEMGHVVGGLCDEYDNVGDNYTGGEPGCANMTIDTLRPSLKWRDFVSSSTPLPTACGAPIDNANDAGAFQGGAGRFATAIWREACNDRMVSNTPPFGPVDYNHMKEVLDPQHEFDYLNSYVGDFDGDGLDDVLIHKANALHWYRGIGAEVDAHWIFTGEWGIWDDIMPGDRFYVGDFNNDNRDDVVVVNMVDWAMPYLALCLSTGTEINCVRRFDRVLPGWGDMRLHDEFYVGDFNADGRDDLYIFNGRDWSIAYLEMLRSTGTDFAFTRRFDDVLPGWGSMKQHDKFFVGDFDNDNRDDIYVFNGEDWAIGYLEMLRSTGTNLSFVRRFDDVLPGWGSMRRRDEFFPADFDADGRKDLYVFNGHDWAIEYLEMLRSTGSNLAFVRRFDATVPGWDGLAPNDKFFVADINGDAREDLYVYNADDWVTEYLGILRSNGSTLGGGWQSNWIGSWNLGQVDRFLVANFNGGAGWDDLFVRNANWFGLLRSQISSVTLNAIYPKWIHNHRHHRLAWW